MSDRDFRLSKDVMPARYRLRIEVDLDNWRVTASEQSDIDVRRVVDTIALHAVDLQIRSVVAAVAGKSVSATVAHNEEAETAIFRFSGPLAVGKARLDIEFSGVILERLRGFYRSQKDG